MRYLHHFLSIMILFLFSLLGNSSITFSQWQNDIRLTNDPGWSTLSFNNARCVAASGDSVHIVWSDNQDGNYEIYYTRSTDGGVNWQSNIRLTNDIATSEYPAIAVSGSVVNIVWIDSRDGNSEVYYKRSTDGGTNWETDVRLTNETHQSRYPSLSVSESFIHLVWADERDYNFEIYYKKSTDEGNSWGSDIRLTNYSADSFNPSVSAQDSGVHLTWYDFRDGNGEIYYKHSLDGGANWESDTRLTNNTASSLSPCISVYNSVVHIVWQDDGIIFYKRSTDAGINWDQEISLFEEDSSFLPSIAVSGSVVHIVWAHEFPLNREIYYIRSTDSGINWEQETRLTDAPDEGWLPSIFISGSALHLVWRDERDGNYEIYYKRNPDANTTGIEEINTILPVEFKLNQNYPNPFNPRTTLSFVIGHQSFVTLKVFDLLGNEVATLLNEEKPAGSYEVEFNSNSDEGQNLSSGVYFYQLVVRGPETSSGQAFVQTRKMVLIR